MWLGLTYKKKTIPIPIPEQIAKLIESTGVKIKELRIQPNLRNAYVIGKTVVLGMPLIDELEIDEVLATVAHELGHIKEKHSLARFIVLLGASLSIWSWWNLPAQIFMIAAMAYFTVCMTPFNWIMEYRADKFAKKYAGGINLKSALLKIADKKPIKEPSEDHPPISKRIEQIE
jgi:STE24 endopeptidase